MGLDLDMLQLILLFFGIALIYSSAGFGGGSSYLAVLALFSFDPADVRMIALLCNVVVVTGSVYIFAKNNMLPYKKLVPLLLFSVPFAYLGGRFLMQERTYFLILASCLMLAGILMIVRLRLAEIEPRDFPAYVNSSIGGVIGFVSGLVGIGGGIFLAPTLHLTHWDVPKRIAASTALFILLNSVAGLLGQMTHFNWDANWTEIGYLLVVVLIGGQIGSRLSIFTFSQNLVRYMASLLILIVAIRIFVKYL